MRPFPGPGGKWLISSNGGMYPMWSRVDGERLAVSANTPAEVVKDDHVRFVFNFFDELRRRSQVKR